MNVNSGQIVLVKNINPDINNGYNSSLEVPNSDDFIGFIEVNDKLYFSADDGEHGHELWVSDGTPEGTELVVDLTPKTISKNGYFSNSQIANLTKMNGRLYFSAYIGTNTEELWVSDGTAEGTRLVRDINPAEYDRYGNTYVSFISRLTGLTELNGKLYFVRGVDNIETGEELWVSDDTAEETRLVKDINPGSSSSTPLGVAEFKDLLYFSADDADNDRELWVSDGTAEGTRLFKDINRGSSSSNPYRFTEFQDLLYFAADDGDNGRELWVSDGTPEGTQLVADINPQLDRFGDGSSSNPRYLTVVGDELFFSADNGETGHELYKLTSDASDMEIVNIAGTNSADILIGDEEDDNIKGLQGNDTLGGKAGNDDLDGDAGNDTLFGVDGDDTLTGGNGDDLLRGQSGNDVLDGGEGNDTLFGGNQFDRLIGYDGNDFLDGGRGIAIYNGGSGSDRFVIRDDAQIWVQDFELDVDVIEFTGSMTFEEIEITGRINSFISFQGQQVGVLLGVNPQDLDRSHFQE